MCCLSGLQTWTLRPLLILKMRWWRVQKEGIFGYSEVQTPYFEIIANWMKLHHNWEIQEDWLIKTPGVVFALAMAVKAYTQPGDSVLIQLPVYYPFSEVIQDNGRKVVSSNLYQGEDNRYHIDFQDFEKKIVEEKCKTVFPVQSAQSGGKSVERRRIGKNRRYLRKEWCDRCQ